MEWKFELRTVADGQWMVYTRGSLEDCLEDMLEFRRGGFNHCDGARLLLER